MAAKRRRSPPPLPPPAPASSSLMRCLLEAKAAAAELEARRRAEAQTRAAARAIPVAPPVPAAHTRRHDAPPLPPRPPQSGAPTAQQLGDRRAKDIEAAITRFLSWGAGWRLPSHRRKQDGAGSRDVWQVFSRQEAAFAWADEEEARRRGHELRFFSVETGENGRRAFIVATYHSFWEKYRGIDPYKRHHYELIRQGWPCHIYFDLEFPRGPNPDLDADRMVDALLTGVEAVLKRRYELPRDWAIQPEWVLELDSTSGTKFSRHLVLQLHSGTAPIAFRNNTHVGVIVREVVELAASDEELAALMMVRKDAESTAMTPFVDLAVYTRNRVFRMAHSSKCGKHVRLMPTPRFANIGKRLRQREIYRRSLVCDVPPDAAVLDAVEADTAAPGASQARQRVAGACTAAAAREASSAAAEGSAGGAGPQQPPSPFPRVDRFIESVCSQGGIQGVVRSWMMLDDANLLVLNIRNNRWCANIGRAHKSNGVFYVVDFQSGCWFQKCYDPECRHFRSGAMPLPAALVPQQASGGDLAVAADAESEEMENDVMIAALEDYELDTACLKAVEELEAAGVI
eukprot:jgi/Tetstr1/440383/TSEL_028717.t1